MNINYRITSTTNFPELKIDDILKKAFAFKQTPLQFLWAALFKFATKL